MNQSYQSSKGSGESKEHRARDTGTTTVSDHLAGADSSSTGNGSDQQLVLTDHERMQIMRRASSGLVRVIVAQAVIGAVVVLMSGLVAGSAAAVSALIGAAAYLVPNTLFAMRLLFGYFGPVQSSPLTFFAGEAFKLGTAVIVLALAAWYGRDWLVWPALLLGLVGVLKGYVLLLLFRKMP